jgi:nucleotide-binding universal stress UspA family protein
LPFLLQAESVMIVEASERRGGEQAARNVRDVADYLRRHRIEAIAERVRPTDVTATNSLLRMIRDENIDLVVAGAYGHSRLGEWAFGGVTRDLLADSPICGVFSH